MTFNIFEGSRRIAMLVAALWILGWMVAAFTQSQPYIAVHYTVSWPDRPPAKVTQPCDYDRNNASEYFTVHTRRGTEAHVSLCFLAHRATDGRKLVFYGADPNVKGQLIGNERHADEVREYTSKVKNDFVLSQTDETWVDDQLLPKWLKAIGIGALAAGGGLVFLWGFTWTTGWVVRGFLGIPRGKDRKESPNA